MECGKPGGNVQSTVADRGPKHSAPSSLQIHHPRSVTGTLIDHEKM